MMSYDVVPRMPSNGVKIFKNSEIDVTEYKTGYQEFKVINVQIAPGSSQYELSLPCFCICVVLKGDGEL